MLTKEQLQTRTDEIKQQVDKSLEHCTNAKAELEKMYGNHNALLGAQILANQLLQECTDDKPVEESYAEVHEAQNHDAE